MKDNTLKKQVIAIGSGGTDAKNPSLELYILAQSPVKNPRVLFLGTASGDNDGYIKYFHQYFDRFPCTTDHLSLFNPPTKDFADMICSSNVVFVGGGHSGNMLTLWKHWGIDKHLRDAYDNGTILSGGSAGSVCWFDECITDSLPGRLSVMPALGILPFSNSPHFSSKKRQEVYAENIATGEIKDGYAIDDDAALHFVDGEVCRSIAIKYGRKSYKMERIDGKCVKTTIPTRYLNNAAMEELVWNSEVFAE